MDLTQKAINAYEAGFVQRYHTHPRFARFGQTDGQHSYGVAALLIVLHPHPSAELLRCAITHDQGERFAGDLPAPVKRDNPQLAADHHILEDLMLLRYFDRANQGLDAQDKAWLKMVDMLECYMFVSLTMPEALNRGPWQSLNKAICNRAAELTPKPRVAISGLMAEAAERQGFYEAEEGNYA